MQSNLSARDIQRLLKELGFDPGPVEGVTGRPATAAVRAFQKAYGLVVDGIAGPQTCAALKQATSPVERGLPEPDKSAMAQPAPITRQNISQAAPPPNAASLVLLDTARQIDELFVHCAATPEGKDFTVTDIRSWHKQRSWSDIGYHYVVYRDGSVHVGRPVGQVGAHAADHNARTIGVVYIGGVSDDGRAAKDTRTIAQRSSLLWLAQKLIAKHRIKRVRGHNEVAAKACPSFDVRCDPLGSLV